MTAFRILGVSIASLLLVGFVNWGFFRPPPRPNAVETKIVKSYTDKVNEMNGKLQQSGLPSSAGAVEEGVRAEIIKLNGLTEAEFDAMLAKTNTWNAYAAEHPEVNDDSAIERPGEGQDYH